LLPALLAGVLGDRAVNGVVHRLVCKQRLKLQFAGDSALLWGVPGEDAIWLLGLEG